MHLLFISSILQGSGDCNHVPFSARLVELHVRQATQTTGKQEGTSTIMQEEETPGAKLLPQHILQFGDGRLVSGRELFPVLLDQEHQVLDKLFQGLVKDL